MTIQIDIDQVFIGQNQGKNVDSCFFFFQGMSWIKKGWFEGYVTTMLHN